MNQNLDTHSTILSRRQENHRRVGEQQFVAPKRPIAGPVPAEVSNQIEAWSEFRDWAFDNKLWETGTLCAQNIETVFDRWYFSQKTS